MSAEAAAQQESEFERRIAFSVIQVAAGILLAEKAYDEFKESTEDLIALNERREAMAETIHDHRLNVTVPFQKSALDRALALEVPSPDYGGLCSFYNSLANSSLHASHSAYDAYSSLLCTGKGSCARQLDFSAGLASVDGVYARGRFDERNQEEIRQLRMDTMQTIHAGTFTNPSGVFGLIESAASVYGFIQNQSFGALSGAVATLSLGVQGLFSGFQGRG